jgi:hypothetical protein
MSISFTHSEMQCRINSTIMTLANPDMHEDLGMNNKSIFARSERLSNVHSATTPIRTPVNYMHITQHEPMIGKPPKKVEPLDARLATTPFVNPCSCQNKPETYYHGGGVSFWRRSGETCQFTLICTPIRMMVEDMTPCSPLLGVFKQKLARLLDMRCGITY